MVNGWDGAGMIRNYLEEERVGSLYTVGIGEPSNRGISYNSTLCCFNGSQSSDLFSYVDSPSSLVGCCLDTVLSPYKRIIDVIVVADREIA